MNAFKISAVIPVHNGKKYLQTAVESVLLQTLPPSELIIVDDGSTDNSIESIQNIKATFPIHFTRQKNLGQSSARNLGARLAQGNYLAFLDQDDIWYPTHLEKLSKLFFSPRLGLAYSNVDEIDEDNQLIRLGLHNFMNDQHPTKSLLDMVGRDLFILPSSTLILKKAFDAVGGFDEKLSGYEDDDLFVRLFSAGWINSYISEALSAWRTHYASSSFQHDRMDQSRMIYAKKLVNKFPDNKYLSRYWTSDIIVPRFLKNILHQYLIYCVRNKDFERSKNLFKQLSQYLELLPKTQQRKWKRYRMLLRWPRVIYFLYNGIIVRFPEPIIRICRRFFLLNTKTIN